MKGLHFKKQSVTKTCRTVLKRCQILLELDEEQGTGLTHALSSLYKAFPASEARRIAKKLEIHYTPKHGSLFDIYKSLE
jgi:hypothetical protein